MTTQLAETQEQTLIANIPASVRIDRSGIEFTEDLSFEQWDSLGRELAPMAKSIGFIVGDWINYGMSRYGEKYQEAVEVTGLSVETLKQYSYVARRIKKCDRSHALDWTHHLVVAKVKEPEMQRDWLKKAEANKLSVSRLRKSINFGRLATDDEMSGDPSDRGTVTYLALINRIRRWWTQENEKLGVDKWDTERKQELKADLQPIVDIYNQL